MTHELDHTTAASTWTSLTDTGSTATTQRQTGQLRYRSILALGQGGMAEVLLSIGRGPGGFNKLVVLKTLRREFIADADMRKMFLDEARLSARLNHPNVVQVHEVIDSALPCIVMEYLEGQAMSTIIHEAGDRFTLPLQLKVISEALAGLHYSHELKGYDGTPLNIVHRDISPQNVFVTYDGVVKVVDFGIAKASDSGTHTQAGIIKGKISYMPREQLLGKGVDRRADIYAIGCMLWRAAAGAKLWQGVADGDVMLALVDGRIPKPSERRPVSPELERIVMTSLALEPGGRYSTALELKLAIDRFLSRTYPEATLDKLRELLVTVFERQREVRSKHIHMALTAPLSEPPPPPATPSDEFQTVVQDTRLVAKTFEVERRKTIAWTAAIALAAVIVVLLGVIALLRWRGGPSDTSHATSNLATAPGIPTQVRIRVGVTPLNATIIVDGTIVLGNPALLMVPIDDREHEIQSHASGYESNNRRIRFERDTNIEVALVPNSQAHAASPQSGAAPDAASGANSKPKRAAARNQPAATSVNCSPPYFYKGGFKHFKPGCL